MNKLRAAHPEFLSHLLVAIIFLLAGWFLGMLTFQYCYH